MDIICQKLYCPNKEYPTQFYPEFPIFRYPKMYTVSGQKDVDLCNKVFDEKRDFFKVLTPTEWEPSGIDE